MVRTRSLVQYQYMPGTLTESKVAGAADVWRAPPPRASSSDASCATASSPFTVKQTPASEGHACGQACRGALHAEGDSLKLARAFW